MQSSHLSASLLRDRSFADRQTPTARPAKGSWLIRWFTSHFHDRQSQVAAVLAFLGALAVSIYWLIWVVEQRWIYSNQHPVQSVTFEPVQSLPAIIGIQVLFEEMFVPAEYTLFRKVIPQLSVKAGRVFNVSGVTCTGSSFFGTEAALCQQTVNGQSALLAGAPTGELNGESASRFELSTLPLQYAPNGGLDGVLCLSIHLFQNRSAMDAVGVFNPPAVIVASFSARSVLSEVELMAAGYASVFDPVAAANFPNDDSATTLIGWFNLDQIVNSLYSASQTIQVDGTRQLELTYSVTGELAIAPSYREREFNNLLTTVQNETARAELMAWRSDSDVAYNVGSFCAQPRSFMVQIVRLQRLYGWGSFLSDAGWSLKLQHAKACAQRFSPHIRLSPLPLCVQVVSSTFCPSPC